MTYLSINLKVIGQEKNAKYFQKGDVKCINTNGDYGLLYLMNGMYI